MDTTLTPAEIRVREQLWSAAIAGAPLQLTPDAVEQLWSSILKTGRELSQLRDDLAFIREERGADEPDDGTNGQDRKSYTV